ncbi:MAG: SAM-dependent methyltransferase [Actinomycetota bacterium]|nr:SAM-dependent methyltransferase [Actinomycetota bacterium]
MHDPPLRVRFDQWVDYCLYDPGIGFYRAGHGRSGRRGDFLTSPEVGPLFGAVLARALDHWWDELGQPGRFPVVDAGSGPGTLLKALEVAAPRCAAAWTLRAADVAPGMTPDLGDVAGGVVLANELLDNLPFRVLVPVSAAGPALDRRLRFDEVFVDRVDIDASAVEVLVPTTWVPVRWVPVQRVPPLLADRSVDGRFPVVETASAWVAAALDRGPARLVAFDYGTQTTVELSARGGWLRTYRRHERGADPYRQPGRWDITTDVPFDQLPSPTRLETQAAFLDRFGIHELVEEGRAIWRQKAARPDLHAMRMRSRVSEADALLDPDGLGGWLVATWEVDQ